MSATTAEAQARVHHLKTWPQFFEKVASGEKTFEIRKNDRDFKVGDVLVLREFDIYGGVDGTYTGREYRCTVTYITDFEQRAGFICMAIKLAGDSGVTE